MPDSATPEVYGYNAEATDYTTGLQYLRARYYNVEVQRFIQEDDYRGKFVSPASLNRYNYVQSNPVKYSDPSGYRPFEEGPKVVKPRPAGMPSNIVKSSTGAGYTAKSSAASAVNKTQNVVSSTAGIPSNINLNKVKNPYFGEDGYGPEWISEDVYNCMKELEEGNGINIEDNLQTIISHADEFIAITNSAWWYIGAQSYSYGDGENDYSTDYAINSKREDNYRHLKAFLENTFDEDGNMKGVTASEMVIDELLKNGTKGLDIDSYAISHFRPEYLGQEDEVELNDILRNRMSEESAREMFEIYSEMYDEGVYYEDITISANFFGGASTGTTIAINIDEEYVAQYVHTGLVAGTPGVIVQLASGTIDGLE